MYVYNETVKNKWMNKWKIHVESTTPEVENKLITHVESATDRLDNANVRGDSGSSLNISNYSIRDHKVTKQDSSPPRPKVWIRRRSQTYHAVEKRAFEYCGYDVITTMDDQAKNWHSVWGLYQAIFPAMNNYLKTSMAPHQRVNHIPGTPTILGKSSLAIANITNTPPAFQLPSDYNKFTRFKASHPDWLWVKKNAKHRGVSIVSRPELITSKTPSFIQRYIDKPFLIDGHRFDIGIYTAITSLNPLRLYVFNDWHLRFCPEKYHPFDPKNRRKYVVESDSYLGPWDIRSINAYFTGHDVTRKTAFLQVLKDKGVDTVKLENELNDSIRKIYLNKENEFVKEYFSQYQYPRNFYELVRVDFLLDEDANIHLMEVNSSPAMVPGKHKLHVSMYEQITFSQLNLVGVCNPTSRDSLHLTNEPRDMQVSSKNIGVHPDKCSQSSCIKSCHEIECKLCKQCLSKDKQLILKQAFTEHEQRHGFSRIFPLPFSSQTSAQQWHHSTDETFNSLNSSNKWMSLWFHGKCLQDIRWCS